MPVHNINRLLRKSALGYGIYQWLLCVVILVIFQFPVQAGEAVNLDTRSITLTLKTEPPTLNSLVSTDQVSTFVLSHIMEGLMQYDGENRLSAGVAERWQVRPDGVTFHLRKNARWTDGKPVTAKDFVFAWQRAVAPETASQYAFILFPIKNAEAINRGEMAAEKLGVQAVNEYELRVQFATACPYFLSLTAFPTYYPVRQDIYERDGQRYAANQQSLINNGAFTVSKWVHGAHLQLKKNPLYWQAGKIRLETIDMPYVTSDNTASFNLFKADSVAMANLTVETIPDALQRGDSLYRFSTGSVYYLGFNFRESRLTRELQLRKAIQAVIDPRVIVNKVIAMPGLLAADSLFPVTVRGVSRSFREEFPAPQVKRGLDVARAYLAAYSMKQSSTLPPLMLLINDTPLAARQAEYFQQLFKTALNIDIRIDKQVFKQYLEKMRRGEYDLTLAGWGPDYDDAMTFADLMASWNENNRGQYQSERYDALVRAAMAETDSQRRFKYIAQLQTVIAEEVPLIPLFENAEIYVQHPNLKGVARSIFGGDPNYRFAWLEAK